jgi:hypothetical protein
MAGGIVEFARSWETQKSNPGLTCAWVKASAIRDSRSLARATSARNTSHETHSFAIADNLAEMELG